MKTLRRLRCTAPGAAACPTLIHQTPQERGECTRRHKVRSFSLKMTQSGKAAGAACCLVHRGLPGSPGPPGAATGPPDVVHLHRIQRLYAAMVTPFRPSRAQRAAPR